MKTSSALIVLLSLLAANAAQARGGKPAESYVFETGFSGAVSGSAISEPTNILGNLLNIVFNKSNSVTEFNISEYFGTCFSNGGADVTMQVYQNYVDAELTVARFWFTAPDTTGTIDVKYVLSVFDTEGVPEWSGAFPPGQGQTIERTAESWEVRPTKKSFKTACSGAGDFDQIDAVTFSLWRD